jgi:hypothetical protein
VRYPYTVGKKGILTDADGCKFRIIRVVSGHARGAPIYYAYDGASKKSYGRVLIQRDQVIHITEEDRALIDALDNQWRYASR